jgi:hypothetical protein
MTTLTPLSLLTLLCVIVVFLSELSFGSKKTALSLLELGSFVIFVTSFLETLVGNPSVLEVLLP